MKIYATNGLAFTNFIGLEADEGLLEKNLNLTVVVTNIESVPITYPTLGGDQFGVHLFTNENNTIWPSLTNIGRYLIKLKAQGTNIMIENTHWQ